MGALQPVTRLPSPAGGGFRSAGFAPVLDILVPANANHGSADCVLENLLTGDYRREARLNTRAFPPVHMRSSANYYHPYFFAKHLPF